MILIRFIGIFFVIMAFYSIGTVAGSGSKSVLPGRVPFPTLLDLAIIFLAWLAAVLAYREGYRTAVAAVIGVGIGLSAGFVLYRLLKRPADQKPKFENPASATRQSDARTQPRWRLFLRQVGAFQSRLMLTGFYFTAIMPFGILVGGLGDPLGLKVPRSETFWKRREDDIQNLEGARRQS